MKARVQLTKKQDNQNLRENIDKILEISDRCEHIIHQLLALSRTMPESAKQVPELVPLDIICNDVIQELKKFARQKKIRIVKDFAKEPYIKANPTYSYLSS